MKLLDPQLSGIEKNFKQICASARVFVFVFFSKSLNLNPSFKFLNWLFHHNFPVELIPVLRGCPLTSSWWYFESFNCLSYLYHNQVDIPRWDVSDSLEWVLILSKCNEWEGTILYFEAHSWVWQADTEDKLSASLKPSVSSRISNSAPTSLNLHKFSKMN